MLQAHELLLQLVNHVYFFVSSIDVSLHLFDNFIISIFCWGTSLGALGSLYTHCYFDMVLTRVL